MPRHRLNRREALGLGVAAVATGSLRPGTALAGPATLFELDLAAPAAASAAAAGWHTTAVLRAPRRFDLIGLRWARGSAAEAQVRARRRGGHWTEWLPLHPAGDHGPDGEPVPAGTDPAWTGAADHFQLRLRGRPRALRARFVRAAPTASLARRAARRLRGSGRAPRAGVAQAGAPPIISRAEWGAAAAPPRADPGYGEVKLAFVHHTVTANGYTREQSAAIVLGILRYHRNSNGWNDIGYNFLVDQYGQVFEGRAGGIEAAVVGAQAQGYNGVSTGIACLGDFMSTPWPEPGMAALAQLIRWKLGAHGVPTQGEVTVTSAGGESNRYPAGAQVTLQRISGHRDGDNTSCPGDTLYGQLAALRARVGGGSAPAGAQVTVRAGRRRVRGAQPVPVSGTLRLAGGGSAAGTRVTVEHRASGRPGWVAVGGAVAAADGAWAATVLAPRSGVLRAVFAGPGGSGRVESRAATITVLTRLDMGLSARRVRRGRRVAVSGVVSPTPRSAKVTLAVERRTRRGWREVSRTRVRVQGGRYLAKVRLRRGGEYRMSVTASDTTRRRLVRVLR